MEEYFLRKIMETFKNKFNKIFQNKQTKFHKDNNIILLLGEFGVGKKTLIEIFIRNEKY